jgi:SAM-dependent methyltransferase
MSEPAPRILTREYYERLKAVEEQHPWAQAMRRLALDLLRRCLGDAAQPVVLDAGCGAGGFLCECGREFNGSVLTGFDLSLVGLKAAQDRGLQRLTAARAGEIPFPRGEFDVVVCHDVLQHLTSGESARALEEFARVLRPGGRLLLRTAARRGLFGKKHLDTPDYRQWAPEQLSAALIEQGFVVEFLARVNWLPGVLADLKALARPRPKGDVGLELDPQSGSGWKGKLLKAYWSLEQRLLLRTAWRPSHGHTLFCLARKADGNAGATSGTADRTAD